MTTWKMVTYVEGEESQEDETTLNSKEDLNEFYQHRRPKLTNNDTHYSEHVAQSMAKFAMS